MIEAITVITLRVSQNRLVYYLVYHGMFNMNITILCIIVQILPALSFLSSCNDDFLDRSSKDKVEAPFFFNTAKDLEVATNALYTMLPDFNIYTEDAASDNLVPLNPSTKIRGNRIVPVGSGSG